MANTQDKIISPFTDVPYMELSDPSEEQEGMYRGVKELQIGQGSSVLRADQQGLWLGAARFQDAPFRVDMQGNITATSLNLSNYLQTGQALGDIGAGNITGTYLASGSISTPKLAANAVTAAKIDVTDLFAQTITATGSITGLTLTGGIVRTSSSGARVQMLSSTNTMQILDSSGTVRAESYSNGWQFNNVYGGVAGRVFVEATFGNLQLQAAGASLFLTAASEISFAPNNGSIISYFNSSGLNMNGQISMGSNTINARQIQLSGGGYINNARAIFFETGQTTRAAVSGEMRYYDGASKHFECYVNGFRGSVDLTAS